MSKFYKIEDETDIEYFYYSSCNLCDNERSLEKFLSPFRKIDDINYECI